MRYVTLAPVVFYLSMAGVLADPGGGGEDQKDPIPRPDGTEFAPSFVRGDVNQNGERDIGDFNEIVKHLYQGGTSELCPDAEDADDNGKIDVADVVYLASFLWTNGPPLPLPNAACGTDPTADDLPECEFNACDLWDGVAPNPGKMTPLWDNWFLWVYADRESKKFLSIIEDTVMKSFAREEAMWVSEPAAVLDWPDRIVILMPEREEEAVSWIVDKRELLARRTAPVQFLLQEGGAAARLLEELMRE